MKAFAGDVEFATDGLDLRRNFHLLLQLIPRHSGRDAFGNACAWKRLPNNLLCIFSVPEVIYDFTELLEGGFEVIDDFLGKHVRIGEIIGFFKAFVSEPEDVEAGLVAVVANRKLGLLPLSPPKLAIAVYCPQKSSKHDTLEEEADKLAGEALIPTNEWDQSPANLVPSPQAVQRLADQLGIHPGIVAGRIRHERKNFRLLNQLVGHGKVRRHFPELPWE